MKVGLKLASVLLAVILYNVIYIPAGIHEVEKEVFESSRENLNVLYEAERYYKRKTRKYTDNFDTLKHFIDTDTLLQNRIKLVALTSDLVTTIDSYIDLKDVTFVSSIYKIRQSSEIIAKIFDEVKDEYRSTPEISELAEELFTLINSLPDDNEYQNFNSVSANVDSILRVKLAVSGYVLQKASNDLITFSEYVMNMMDDIETSELKNTWLGIEKDVKLISERMLAPGMKPQSKTNRLNKQIGVIIENLDRLSSRNKAAVRTTLESKHQNFTSIRDTFAEAVNFSLSQRGGQPFLNEQQTIISRLNEKTIMAPPLDGAKYIMELEQRGFKISCPNSSGTITRSMVFSQHYKNYGFVSNQGKSWDEN